MSSSPHTDSFARVSAALLAVWPKVADPTAGLSRAELGQVLDECGSDYRPLVDLLVDLGRTVRPALAGGAPQSASTWVHVRAPLVHRLVSTRYLQPDVARWAVDVWGLALGVAPHQPVSAPTVKQHVETSLRDDPTTGHATTTTGPAPTAATARAPLPRPQVLTPQQVPAALRQVPSWAGGPVSFGTGQKPNAANLARLAQSGRVIVRSPVPSGPMFQPAERRAALILAALLVLITGGLMNAFRGRPTVTTPVDAMAAPVADIVSGAAATAARVTATGETAPSVRATSVTATGVTATSVTATSVTAPGVTAARGRVADVLSMGVGGTYVVTQRVRDVSGSESCDAVAQALATGRESRETVAHVPGQPQFTLVTRGVTGTLDADGVFSSEPRVGTTNNVNWRFRMRGRFGPAGFTGESVTHTDAILRWGKIQTCVVTAELAGRRLTP